MKYALFRLSVISCTSGSTYEFGVFPYGENCADCKKTYILPEFLVRISLPSSVALVTRNERETDIKGRETMGRNRGRMDNGKKERERDWRERELRETH